MRGRFNHVSRNNEETIEKNQFSIKNTTQIAYEMRFLPCKTMDGCMSSSSVKGVNLCITKMTKTRSKYPYWFMILWILYHHHQSKKSTPVVGLMGFVVNLKKFFTTFGSTASMEYQLSYVVPLFYVFLTVFYVQRKEGLVKNLCRSIETYLHRTVSFLSCNDGSNTRSNMGGN